MATNGEENESIERRRAIMAGRKSASRKASEKYGAHSQRASLALLA